MQCGTLSPGRSYMPYVQGRSRSRPKHTFERPHFACSTAGIANSNKE